MIYWETVSIFDKISFEMNNFLVKFVDYANCVNQIFNSNAITIQERIVCKQMF
jgi:hypothetical protein